MTTETTPDGAASKIVARVAALRDVEPTALPPLQRTVDVDALSALLDGRFSGVCTFTYAGCEVSVGGADRLQVTRCHWDGAADAAGPQR